MFKIFASTALVALAIGVAPFATASPISIADAYVGGHDHNHGDLIGNPNVFSTAGATVNRSGTHLIVTINTSFAGKPGSGPAKGATYGDLLLAATWSPIGAAPYTTDLYQAGDWTYAVKSSGPNIGDIYRTDSGNVVMSSAPNGIFRDGQAVGWNGGTKAGEGTFTVGAGTLTFDFDASSTGFLFGPAGFDFALSWTMTSADDAFQGQVGTGSQPATDPGTTVPEPASALLLLVGLGGVAAARTRR